MRARIMQRVVILHSLFIGLGFSLKDARTIVLLERKILVVHDALHFESCGDPYERS